MKANMYINVNYRVLLRDVEIPVEIYDEIYTRFYGEPEVKEDSEAFDWISRHCKEEDGCFQSFEIINIETA